MKFGAGDVLRAREKKIYAPREGCPAGRGW
jgi:hypothetical protein